MIVCVLGGFGAERDEGFKWLRRSCPRLTSEKKKKKKKKNGLPLWFEGAYTGT